MFMFPPPPIAQQSRGPSPAKSRRTNSVVWIECIFFAALGAVVSLGLVYGPRTAEADFVVSGLKTEWITSLSQYPIPGSVYSMSDEVGGGVIQFGEKQSDRLEVYFDPAYSIALPGPGATTEVEVLFEVSFSLNQDEFLENGAGKFSVMGQLPPPADFAGLSDALPMGEWHLEVLELGFSFLSTDMPGVTYTIRESPTLASLGQHVLTPLPDGSLHIDSFFDVFFEVSVDGGPFVPADSPVRLDITAVVPEASQLLALGLLALIPIVTAWRRRNRTAAA